MPDASPQETVQAFWEAMRTNDFAKTSLLLAEAYTLRYPQSGETFRGCKAFVRLNTEDPANGLWRFSVNRLVADENTVVSDVDVTDGVGSECSSPQLLFYRERADYRAARVLARDLRGSRVATWLGNT